MRFGMTFSAHQSFKCKVDQQHKLGERQKQPQNPKPTMRIPFQDNKGDKYIINADKIHAKC